MRRLSATNALRILVSSICFIRDRHKANSLFDFKSRTAPRALNDLSRFHVMSVGLVESLAAFAGERSLLWPEVEILAIRIVPAVQETAAN
jgi:hypothetical protein